jgi:DeoR/GlpR family transcriptional regulator of sugar metabolism
MLAAERKKIILEKLQSEKKVVVSELCEIFKVSDETIRRDLDRVCQEGIAIKTYGGAVLNEDGPDLPFNVRKIHNPDEKKKIAELVEPLINDGDSIMLDASTTAVFIAKKLKTKKRLTVITNSIEVMVELSDMRDWTVISTGGYLMGDYLAFSGQRANIASFCADKLIFSCKGLDIQHGILDSNDALAQVKRDMFKAAKTKILAADFSKFNRTAFSKIADINSIDIMVTDKAPGKEWERCFAKDGVRCLYL